MPNHPSRIVILTGAGISADSGLATFRAQDGLWENHSTQDVATPQGFAANPALVHEFYNMRRHSARAAQPNAAHRAIAELCAALPKYITLITQNIDDLFERAGCKSVIHMHGEIERALCANAQCAHRWDAPSVMSTDTLCPRCKQKTARPDIVWFGEMPYYMEHIDNALQRADLFVAIGTSGNVYPAAGFVKQASAQGANTLELNLEPSQTAAGFDQAHYGRAVDIVPRWVQGVISQVKES